MNALSYRPMEGFVTRPLRSDFRCALWILNSISVFMVAPLCRFIMFTIPHFPLVLVVQLIPARGLPGQCVDFSAVQDYLVLNFLHCTLNHEFREPVRNAERPIVIKKSGGNAECRTVADVRVVHLVS